MKKIKIIDILCYISLGEYNKIPKKIKWTDGTWKYDDRMQDYTNGYLTLFEQLKNIITEEFLNNEVEILDEEDEFEDIEEINNAYYHESQDRINQTFKLAINDLIKNQKKIIERLKDGE